MKNIVLFGPPGSGKGTQANNIISKYKLVHLSTGDMLRAEIAAQTSLGKEAKALMDKGELVPDAVVIGMIENQLNTNPKAAGFVFDGFPRTVNQAIALDKLLDKRGDPIQKVLSLKVSEDELTKRILERGKTSGRADDQNEGIVKNRVAEYRTKTEPLAEYYNKQNKLVEIQGEGTVDHISDLLNYEIDNIKTNGVVSEVASLISSTVENLFHKKDKSPSWPEAAEVTGEKDINYAPVAKKVAVKSAPKKASAPVKKVVAPAKKVAVKAISKKAVAPAKKATPKKVAKKVAPKKAVKKALVKKAIKKAAPKKVVAKKAIKKIAPKKVVKKAPAKKVAKKVAPKKAAPKKAVTKKVIVKKVIKKAVPKKVVKKAAPKKIVKKVAPKKAAPKKIVKKVAAKKVIKKAAPKKVVKKAAAKKAAKKAAPKKVIKKALPKKAYKKIAAKKRR
jgi:adenylate kinase